MAKNKLTIKELARRMEKIDPKMQVGWVYEDWAKLAFEALRQYRSAVARAGGKARAKKLTKAERSQAARDAVNARWARLNKVKFDV